MTSTLRTTTIFLLALLSACAGYAPAPFERLVAPARTYSQTLDNVSVSASILTDEEARTRYGVDLSDAGLQAIWLRIENRSAQSFWLLVSASDANYFPPDEASVLFQWKLDNKADAQIVERFRELAINLKTASGETSEGYLLAPRQEGGRYLPVLLLGKNKVLEYGFSIPLPDGEYDFEHLGTSETYTGTPIEDVDIATLRARLRDLPCCTNDASGERQGDPVNVVFIGDQEDVLYSLLRSGWSFTQRIDADSVRRLVGAAISGAEYAVAPISPLYMFGRQQDVAMQRARSNVLQRNHIRLWLAPLRVQGLPVWVGQVSRDISIKLTTLSPNLATHVIAPNVDEAREHLLQSLIVAGTVKRFAFVSGAPVAGADEPRLNLTNDPYFSDGMRLMVQVSNKETIQPQAVEFIEWQDSVDPIRHLKPPSPAGNRSAAITDSAH
ncbi:LssY C-terminal domain-containing protein [Haliea sp. E17]|uniref:LssY C-terminal domain-containing protein n=1 Tax=Haliea sp. E17 TaxID=3401576 RepID=UPI003AAE3E3C